MTNKTVAIIPTKNAYLPEIVVYKDVFQDYKLDAQVIDKPNKEILEKFHIIWMFMGIDVLGKNRNDQLLIHEYQSASVRPFPRLKDKIKKIINKYPDVRIFQNAQVQNSLGFNSNIHTYMRPMGFRKNIFVNENIYNKKIKYDFVYVGTLNKRKSTIKYLLDIGKAFVNRKILIIGYVPDKIKRDLYKVNINFYFTGTVSYDAVPKLLKECEFGLNFVPDEYPYNQQDSTKLIEYSVLGLKIISTDNPIAREFQQKYSVPIIFIKDFTKDLTEKKIFVDQFSNQFIKGELYDLSWEKIIHNLFIRDGLLEVIKKI